MRRVDIPFLAGQNEAVDRKLLPDGQLLSARNVVMDRDGRMVRRRALRTVDTDTPKQEGPPGQLRALMGDDLVLVDVPDHLGHAVGQVSRFSYEGAFKECMRLVGESSAITSPAGFYQPDTGVTPEVVDYLPVGAFRDIRRSAVGSSGRKGFHVTSVAHGIARDGTVIVLIGMQDSFRLEMRDPETLELMHAYFYNVPSITRVALAVSRTFDACAVVWGVNTGTQIKAFSTVWPYSESNRLRVHVEDNNSVVAVDYEDHIHIVTQATNAGDETIIALVDWADIIAPALEDASVAYGTAHFPSGSLFDRPLAIWADTDAIGYLTYGDVGPDLGLKLHRAHLVTNALSGRRFPTIDGYAQKIGPTVQTGGVYFDGVTWHIAVGEAEYENIYAGGTDSPIWRGYDWRLVYLTQPDESMAALSTTADTMTEEATANHLLPVSQPIVDERGVWAVCEVTSGNDDYDAETFVGADNFTSGIQVIDLVNMRPVAQVSDEVGGVSRGGSFPDPPPLLQVRNGSTSFKIQRVTRDGERFLMTLPVAVDETTTIAHIVSMENGHGHGITTRDGETLVSGGGAFFTDTHAAGPSFFSAAPEITNVTTGFSTDNPESEDTLPGIGTYLFAALLEWRDASGQLWRSPPSATHQHTFEPVDPEVGIFGEAYIEFDARRGPGAPSGNGGVRLVVFLKAPSSETLNRFGDYPIDTTGTVHVRLGGLGYPPDLASREAIYTAGGELANDAPPPCDFLAVGKTRAWMGGLPDRTFIKCSKPLAPGLGVEWSNFNTFLVSLPDEVTGLAVMDETVVVLTKGGVFLVHGDGPGVNGIGEFPPPQKVPTGLGCVSHLSVATNEAGVWYQTRRGLELLPRGFSAPQWVGQGVRDVTRAFPRCWGSRALPDGTVRWLFGSADGAGDFVVIVWDQRAASWFVHDYPASEVGVGEDGPRSVGLLLEQVTGDVSVALISADLLGKEIDREARPGPVSVLETGHVRPAGLNAQHYGRRVNVLGEWLGPCVVTLAFAFNDQDYLPTDFVTWTLDEDEYSEGEPVELEVTLPVMKFSAVQFKLSWEPLSATVEHSFAANGLTVWFERADMGQRVAARSKG